MAKQDAEIGAAERDWPRIAPVVPPPPLPIDLASLPPKDIEESFEDPFALKLLPDGENLDASSARYFSLGKIGHVWPQNFEEMMREPIAWAAETD